MVEGAACIHIHQFHRGYSDLFLHRVCRGLQRVQRNGRKSGHVGTRRSAIPERRAACAALGITGCGRLGRKNRCGAHCIGTIPLHCRALDGLCKNGLTYAPDMPPYL